MKEKTSTSRFRPFAFFLAAVTFAATLCAAFPLPLAAEAPTEGQTTSGTEPATSATEPATAGSPGEDDLTGAETTPGTRPGPAATDAPAAAPANLPVVPCAPEYPVSLTVDINQGLPYFGTSGAFVVVVADTGQGAIGFETYSPEITNGSQTVAAEFFGRSTTTFQIPGDMSSGTWYISKGEVTGGFSPTGSIELQSAEEALSLSNIKVEKANSNDLTDRNYTFSCSIINGGAQDIDLNIVALVPVFENDRLFASAGNRLPATTADLVIPTSGMLKAGETATFNKTFTVDSATPADAGFTKLSVSLEYAGTKIPGATTLLMPYASSAGVLARNIFGGDETYNHILGQLLAQDGISADLLAEPLLIPAEAANQFTGAFFFDLINLSTADLGFLSHFPNITGLHMRGCGLDDISALSALTNLTYLDLGINLLTNVTPLANLTKLEQLFLEKNKLTDIRPLAGLTSLRDLSLADNTIADVSPLAGLTNLSLLNLDKNRIQEIGLPAALLGNLSLLAFSKNPLKDLLFLNNINWEDPNLLIVGTGLSLSMEAQLQAQPSLSAAAMLTAPGLSLGAAGRLFSGATSNTQTGILRVQSTALLPSAISFTLAAENGGSASGTALSWQNVPAGQERAFTFRHWQGNVENPYNADDNLDIKAQGIYLDGRAIVKTTAIDSSSDTSSSSSQTSSQTSSQSSQSGDVAVTNGPASPQTGDATSIAFFASLGLGALATLLVLVKRKYQ